VKMKQVWFSLETYNIFFLWHMFTLLAILLDQLAILVRVMPMDYEILAI
jgi:hypothetical protein